MNLLSWKDALFTHYAIIGPGLCQWYLNSSPPKHPDNIEIENIRVSTIAVLFIDSRWSMGLDAF